MVSDDTGAEVQIESPPQGGDSLARVAIRTATPADAAGVAGIINTVIAEGRFSLLDTPLTEAAERAYIEGLPERGFIHVAELPEHGVVGLQTLAPYADFMTHELDHVATMGTWIAAPWRGKGLGRRLWQATRRRAIKRGFEKIVTDVRADNSGSLAFHGRLGFVVIGTARRQARVPVGPFSGGGEMMAAPEPSSVTDAGVRGSTARAYVDVVFIERFLDADGEG